MDLYPTALQNSLTDPNILSSDSFGFLIYKIMLSWTYDSFVPSFLILILSISFFNLNVWLRVSAIDTR